MTVDLTAAEVQALLESRHAAQVAILRSEAVATAIALKYGLDPRRPMTLADGSLTQDDTPVPELRQPLNGAVVAGE
jgi:hypothetical protein